MGSEAGFTSCAERRDSQKKKILQGVELVGAGGGVGPRARRRRRPMARGAWSQTSGGWSPCRRAAVEGERERDRQVRERQDGAALRSGREVMMSSFTDTDDGCDWPVQSSSSSSCLDPALPPRTFTNDVRNVAACRRRLDRRHDGRGHPSPHRKWLGLQSANRIISHSLLSNDLGPLPVVDATAEDTHTH